MMMIILVDIHEMNHRMYDVVIQIRYHYAGQSLTIWSMAKK